MDGGAWWAAVPGVAKSPTRLSDFTLTFHFHALEKDPGLSVFSHLYFTWMGKIHLNEFCLLTKKSAWV